MDKLKICVYTIALNEEQFVKRWVDSAQEADALYVLDTGSTDNTVNLLKKYGVNVQIQKIVPWRFDAARNKALEMIPNDYDICISLDLDEVLLPGWRIALESVWKKDITTRLRYIYNWRLSDDNKPIVSFYCDKIHSRQGYKWTHPVHEVLKRIDGLEVFVQTDELIINHYPDSQKSRSSYLPLLEMSVLEDPQDDRNMHYLGREYMYYGEFRKAIKTLKKHLKLKTATWKDERAASMRFIARCYKMLGNYRLSNRWYKLAIAEAPYLRDAYIEKAMLDHQQAKYLDVVKEVLEALTINNKSNSYINEVFSFNETPYDLLSIAFYNLKMYDLSLIFINKALAINPKDERLLNNKKIIEEKVV